MSWLVRNPTVLSEASVSPSASSSNGDLHRHLVEAITDHALYTLDLSGLVTRSWPRSGRKLKAA